MAVNKAKTEELVFCRPHPTIFDMPDLLDGISQERRVRLAKVGQLSFNPDIKCYRANKEFISIYFGTSF